MATGIEWCDETINPVSGCSPISEGCKNCYAQKMSKRLAGRFGYPKDEPFRVAFHPNKLKMFEKWKKPRRIFVCSMSDLFHPDVPDHWIDEVFERMANAQNYFGHTFIVLTKRPRRMAECIERYRLEIEEQKQQGKMHFAFPLRNIWLGVTVESNKYLWRVGELLSIPAAVRFVSFEPLLENVEIPEGYINKLDWAIVGGETGPGKRICAPSWMYGLYEQCQKAQVPFFFKQFSAPLDGMCKCEAYERMENTRQFPGQNNERSK